MINPEEYPTDTQTEVIDSNVETEKQPIDVSQMSKFEAWAAEQRQMPFKQFDKITKGFGEVGLRLGDSWKSDELSLADKAGATVAAGVGFLGEGIKGVTRFAAAGQLASNFGERSSDIYQAGMGGFVDTFSEKVAKKEQNGTYSFDAAGIAEFANVKSLTQTAVEGIGNGVDAGMEQTAEFAAQDLVENPDTEWAQNFNKVNDVYDSKAGQVLQEKLLTRASNAAVDRAPGA